MADDKMEMQRWRWWTTRWRYWNWAYGVWRMAYGYLAPVGDALVLRPRNVCQFTQLTRQGFPETRLNHAQNNRQRSRKHRLNHAPNALANTCHKTRGAAFLCVSHAEKCQMRHVGHDTRSPILDFSNRFSVLGWFFV